MFAQLQTCSGANQRREATDNDGTLQGGVFSLTVLQRGDGLALLTVLTVPDVIGGFNAELVGSERL